MTLRARPALLALAAYLIASLVLFGAPLWHDGECVCGQTPDAGTYAWSMEWWPHAIAHGLNPFFPHIIYAPEGINLAHGQLAPAAALILAPVTAVAGGLFSLNLALVLAPALAAFFTFLLCRRITSAFWPSLAGGWLFGFSTAVLAQMTSHLNLALVFPIPAIVHLVLRRADGDISRRAFVGLTALACVALFGFSPELFVAFVAFGAVAVLLCARRLIAELVGALAVTAVIVSPYLYYATKPGMLPILPDRTEKFSNDLLGFVLPQPTTILGGARPFTAELVEGAAYLSVPLLLLLVWAVVRGGQRERLLGAALAVIALLSLGAHLHVNGQRHFPLPWAAFNNLPLAGDMLPARFSVFVALCAALLAALWAARGGWLAWVLVAASVILLLPDTGSHLWRSRPATPALFTDHQALTSRDTVLVLPEGISGNGMLWQARDDLRWRMAGGYVVAPEAPDPYKDEAIYPMLSAFRPVANADAAMREFLQTHGVTAVVIAQTDSARTTWVTMLERLGWEPREVGGATLIRRAVQKTRQASFLQVRAVVIQYLRRVAARDATGACRLFTPDGLGAVTKTGIGATVEQCAAAFAPALPAISGVAARSRFLRADITGTRAAAHITGGVTLPVRLSDGTWRIDGPTSVSP